jgi:hypothetical protein
MTGNPARPRRGVLSPVPGVFPADPGVPPVSITHSLAAGLVPFAAPATAPAVALVPQEVCAGTAASLFVMSALETVSAAVMLVIVQVDAPAVYTDVPFRALQAAVAAVPGVR